MLEPKVIKVNVDGAISLENRKGPDDLRPFVVLYDDHCKEIDDLKEEIDDLQSDHIEEIDDLLRKRHAELEYLLQEYRRQ